MRNQNQVFKNWGLSRQIAMAAVAMLFVSQASDSAKAAVQGVGDVLPQQTFIDVPFGFGDDEQLVTLTAPDLPFSGGRLQITMDDGMGGETSTPQDLIVGGTGEFSGTTLEDGTQIGTTVGSVTINSPTNTLPLIAPEVHVGQEFNGRGRITVTDFNATLIAEEELFVGEDGKGEIRLLNGAVLGVGEYNAAGNADESNYENGDAFIGLNRRDTGVVSERFVSEGLVFMDGFGTRFDVDDLVVGGAGLGTLEMSGQAITRTATAQIGQFASGTGRVSLTGLLTRWDNEDTLAVGVAGNGILEVNDQAVVVSETITVNPTSFIEMAGGTLISRQPIVTDGIIRGSGRIESDLTIGSVSRSLGELRNYGVNGDNSPAQAMVVTGEVTNEGTIQALGGIMEFQSVVNNNFEMVLRDTEVHFKASVINGPDGTISIGGDTTLHGTVTSGGGSIFVLSDSESLLVGDLTFTGSGVLGLTLGEDAGTLDVTGSADIASAILALDYSAGVAPVVGDSYQIFQADGGISFADTTVAGGGVLWDVVNTGTSLIATFNGAIAAPVGADFNGDNVVDILDLTIWENNYPIASGAMKAMGDADGDGDVDGSDLLKIQRDFGMSPPPPIAASSVVPEPSTLALAMLTVMCFPRRRATR